MMHVLNRNCFAEENSLTDGKLESSQPLSQPPDNSAMCPATSKYVICFMYSNLQLVSIYVSYLFIHY